MLKHILAFCACIPTLSSRMNFDWLMRKAIKYLLASLLLFVLAGAVHAEEGKWIDGIKFRYGTLSNTTTFKLPWVEDEGSIIEVNKEEMYNMNANVFSISEKVKYIEFNIQNRGVYELNREIRHVTQKMLDIEK